MHPLFFAREQLDAELLLQSLNVLRDRCLRNIVQFAGFRETQSFCCCDEVLELIGSHSGHSFADKMAVGKTLPVKRGTMPKQLV